MRKGFWIASVLVAVLVLFAVPKTDYREDPYSIYVCNCIGFSTDKCFGITKDCDSFVKPRNLSLKTDDGADITLVLDKSKSMEGTALTEAKNAAIELIDMMSPKDKMSVIEFDKQAEIIQGFTNDRQILYAAVRSLNASDETFFEPAIERVIQNYKDNSDAGLKKIVFLSDGEPSNKESLPEIYKYIYEATGASICLYTIGYGNRVQEGSKAEQVLRSMSDISFEQAGCGGYYRSEQDDVMLSDIFGHIYTDLLNQDLQIKINEPRGPVFYTTKVLFNLSTNMHAVCSYQLNHNSPQLIFNNSFMLDATPGRNRLEVVCRKTIGAEETVTQVKEFFVKVGLFSQVKRQRVNPTHQIEPLDDDEIEFLLDDIVEQQRLNIVRRMSPQYGGTLVYVLIENTKPVTLRNLKIKQTIPPQITTYPDDISSSQKYQFTSLDPIELEFSFTEIAPDEIISFSYFINQRLDSLQLNNIRTLVKFDDVSRADIRRVISQQNQTRNLLDVSTGFENTEDGARGIVNINPNTPIKDLKVYLNVPKCMAYNLNKIYFKNTNYRVIAQDPLILWQLSDVEDSVNIEYELDKQLETECERKLEIVTVGAPVEQDHATEEAHNTIIFLFPLLLLPLVLLFVVNKKMVAHQATKERLRLVRVGLFLVFVVCLLLFLYPKDRFKEEKLCECFGVGTSETCFGLGYSCVVPRAYVEVKESKAPTCDVNSCESLRQYLNVDPYSRAIYGVDLVLLVDHSKSMEDGKMERAKAALTNLIQQAEDHTRLSIIQFDSSSEVIQDFTLNRSQTVDSLKDINLGLSTKYVPALTTAHQNFLADGQRKNEWQIIFVSDGAPGDSAEEIFKKVTEMTQDEICVNTIGFGEEIPDSEAETILKEMARISRQHTGCGSYLYSKIDIDTLSEVLGRVYKESQIRRVGLDIDMQVSSLRLSTIEEFIVDVRLYSMTNGQSIPGEYQIGNQQFCSPLADIVLHLENGTHKFNYTGLNYDPVLRKYALKAVDIPPGIYTASLSTELNVGLEDCDISDTMYIGEIEVFEYDEFSACMTDDCYEINSYLFSNHTEKSLFVYITDYAFVPQNISITSGTKVIWKNIGQKPHTVTSGKNEYDGLFHSGIMYPGDVFNYSFDKGETHEYFDNLSKSLRGDMNINRTRNYSIGNFSLEYRNNIDLSILIDHSGSMSGSKLENVKIAARKLVYIIYPGDRVSVVRFSDDANIMNQFTDDRPILVNTIDKLSAGGKTLFIPAFEKAGENYMEWGRPNAGKVVIFLSDGEPWDEEGEYGIYNVAEKLIDNGICIYAIGYGNEVFKGSKSEAILQNIVDLSQDSTSCGHYKYSPSDDLRLTKIFGSIYHEAIGEMEGLKLESSISKKVMYDNETLKVRTKVRSNFNNNYLPGLMNATGFELCGPPARVTAEIFSRKGTVIKQVFMSFIGESGYYADISGLDPGRYMIVIKAESISSSGDTCNYIGTERFEFNVISSQKIVVDPLFLLFLLAVAVTAVFAFWNKKT